MSADLLRRAAALMRERAEYAPDGPWQADVRSDGAAWIRFAVEGDGIAAHGYPAAARHIASWHPAVALAVADWLEAHAAVHVVHDPRALAVARAYLGSES